MTGERQGRTQGTSAHWLMKSEPDTFGIDHLAREGESWWDGVRNYQARNFMRDDMRVGDWVLFYHSSCAEPGVVGLARVVAPAEPDRSAFDPRSDYFDPKSDPAHPRWVCVKVGFVERFERALTLQEIRSDPALQHMWVIQRGQRLSIQPVEPQHFAHILHRVGARTPVEST